MNFHSCEKQIFNHFISAVLKFVKTQNNPIRGKMKQCNPQPTTIHDQFVLTMSTTRQILTILLLTEEALFACAFRR